MPPNKNKTADSFLSRLKFLASPFALGIYVTMIFTSFSFYYYIQKENLDDASIFSRIFNDIDQKSLDYRLRFRGPRKGSDRVAILAIDDESIEDVGRWPWPRDRMANLFKNVWDNGANVIAADIIWSEATDKPQEKLAAVIKDSLTLDEATTATIDKALVDLDGDIQFYQTIEEYTDKFVAGTFFSDQSHLDFGKGYVAACNKLIFEGSKAGQLFYNDQLPLIAIDSNDLYMPDALTEPYKAYLKSFEELGKEAHVRRLEYCYNDFLTPQDALFEPISKSWNTLLQNEDSLKSSSFEEWAQNFRFEYLANQVYETNYWTVNIEELNDVTSFSGYFNARLDGDGTIRRANLVMRSGNQYISTLALKAYLVATNQLAEIHINPNQKIQGAKGITSIQVNNGETGNANFTVPVSSDSSLLINYAGPQRMFPYIRASSLLDPNSETMIISERYYDEISKKWLVNYKKEVNRKEFLKDKILIAGATAIGVYDLRVSPFEENFPGVETHANILDNLLRKDFLSTDPQEPISMPVFLLVFGILLSFILARVGASWGLVLTFIFLVGISIIDRNYFFNRGIAMSVALPLLLTSTLYILMTFYKYLTEERGRKELRQTFSKYVSPQIVSEILQDPKNLELGGRKEDITVFFSDVRGFTTLSEQLDPKDLSDLLNSYLTPMTELIFKNQGTLDKYIGDAIMAFFGAPLQFKDHPSYACRSALQQIEKLKELQKDYAKKSLPYIDIGIGLNSGEASVGNMGSETVRNYTVMGDTVNLAARLEGITKEYGVRIVISESTYAAVKDNFICRLLDQVRVKGKLKPVKIYELISEGRVDAPTETLIQCFEDGFKYYQAKKFQDAISAFEKGLEAIPEDKASAIYIERCKDYLDAPPPEDWDGVYVMTKK